MYEAALYGRLDPPRIVPWVVPSDGSRFSSHNSPPYSLFIELNDNGFIQCYYLFTPSSAWVATVGCVVASRVAKFISQKIGWTQAALQEQQNVMLQICQAATTIWTQEIVAMKHECCRKN